MRSNQSRAPVGVALKQDGPIKLYLFLSLSISEPPFFFVSAFISDQSSSARCIGLKLPLHVNEPIVHLLLFREPAEGLHHSLKLLSSHVSETTSLSSAAILQLCFVKGHLVCCS